jgi:N-acetylmuramoyl-L-alanine amidase
MLKIITMDRKIDKIIIHCTATPEGRDVSVDTIREWHLENGWSDIGYHYVVGLDGLIHDGRPVEKQGAHTKGHNRGSIGIVYVGGVDERMDAKDTRTDEQKESLELLVLNLLDSFPKSTVHGHNEFSSKECPSYNVQREYKEIIKNYEHI